MAADIKSLLAAGRYQLPDEGQCAQLQEYWDDLCAQAGRLAGVLGPAEPATTYTAWRAGDD